MSEHRESMKHDDVMKTPDCPQCGQRGRLFVEVSHIDLKVQIWSDHECCDTLEPFKTLQIDEMTEEELASWGWMKTTIPTDAWTC